MFLDNTHPDENKVLKIFRSHKEHKVFLGNKYTIPILKCLEFNHCDEIMNSFNSIKTYGLRSKIWESKVFLYYSNLILKFIREGADPSRLLLKYALRYQNLETLKYCLDLKVPSQGLWVNNILNYRDKDVVDFISLCSYNGISLSYSVSYSILCDIHYTNAYRIFKAACKNPYNKIVFRDIIRGEPSRRFSKKIYEALK